MSPAAKIFILDKDTSFSCQLAHSLAECGYSTSTCSSGEQGLVRAVSEKIDLILLNVDLPQINGLEFLRNLRKSRSTPVVLMENCEQVPDEEEISFSRGYETSRTGREQLRIEAFRLGADDYWHKSVNFTEMQLRVAAILRRSCGWVSDPHRTDTLQAGPLHLDRRNLKVRVDHREVDLTQVQFKLLWHLASHQNQVLPKAYLHALVLEKPYTQHDRSIDMHLSRVRRKLTDVGLNADRVQTVHGRGYCFA